MFSKNHHICLLIMNKVILIEEVTQVTLVKNGNVTARFLPLNCNRKATGRLALLVILLKGLNESLGIPLVCLSEGTVSRLTEAKTCRRR